MGETDTATQLSRLENVLRVHAPVAVALSGGVDSMTLAFVAHRVDPNSEMYHAVSAAVPKAGTARVKDYAQRHGWSLKIIDAGEMADPNYQKNPVNRCYFCKSNLYSSLTKHSNHTIVSGTNTDDLSDYRPGLIAAKERNIVHPFVEAGINKMGIRAIAKQFGLEDLAQLPASPCLSSRVTTGITIDQNLLPLIDEVESHIWKQYGEALALKAVRCRVQSEQIAIQLDCQQNLKDPATFQASLQQEIKQAVGLLFQQHGYAHLQQIHIEPYRRGSAFLIESVNLDH